MAESALKADSTLCLTLKYKDKDKDKYKYKGRKKKNTKARESSLCILSFIGKPAKKMQKARKMILEMTWE